MHRRVGISGIQQKQAMQTTYKQVGTQIEAAEVTKMQEQLKVFQSNLEEFAKKYKKEITKNPEFRKYFADMCSKIGVDPLASNKGFWAEMLGVGDFYYELGVQMVEVCLKTRALNGGLIEINELNNFLTQMRGKNAQEISPDDIERAAKKLKILGSGFQVITIGSQKMVQSVPCELNTDHTTILALAQEKHFVTATMIEKELKEWKRNRIDAVLELLQREGMIWIDDQSELGERQYWFPSLIGGTLQVA